EKTVVRPGKIFKNKHDWLALGDCLEKASPSGKGFRTPVPRLGEVGSQSQQRPEMTLDPFGLRRVGRSGDPGLQLRVRDVDRIGLEHSELRLDDLGERPV